MYTGGQGRAGYRWAGQGEYRRRGIGERAQRGIQLFEEFAVVAVQSAHVIGAAHQSGQHCCWVHRLPGTERHRQNQRCTRFLSYYSQY